jgi:hypothetical protein
MPVDHGSRNSDGGDDSNAISARKHQLVRERRGLARNRRHRNQDYARPTVRVGETKINRKNKASVQLARRALGGARLSIHLVSVYVDSKDDEAHPQLDHAVELNNIHIALQRSEKLSRWMPAKSLQALDLAPPYNYAKYYDTVATIYFNNKRMDIAIEYEHTLKRPIERYAKLKAELAKEQRADAILFVVPTPEIKTTLWSQLVDLRQNIIITKLQDLIVQGLGAAVDLNYLTLTLGDALKRVSEQKRT